MSPRKRHKEKAVERRIRQNLRAADV